MAITKLMEKQGKLTRRSSSTAEIALSLREAFTSAKTVSKAKGMPMIAQVYGNGDEATREARGVRG